MTTDRSAYRNYQDGCPFCERISRGEYDQESRYAVAFPPLNPVTDGHLLVVSKRHVANAMVEPGLTGYVFQFAAELARDTMQPANLITNIGGAASQSVWHLHVHIVPRRHHDGLKLPWSRQHLDLPSSRDPQGI